MTFSIPSPVRVVATKALDAFVKTAAGVIVADGTGVLTLSVERAALVAGLTAAAATVYHSSAQLGQLLQSRKAARFTAAVEAAVNGRLALALPVAPAAPAQPATEPSSPPAA